MNNSYQQKLEQRSRPAHVVIAIVVYAALAALVLLFLFPQVYQAAKPEKPSGGGIDSQWIEAHSPADEPVIATQIITTIEVYEKPTPEGWNGWTSYSYFLKGKREDGGFHWTYDNADSLFWAKALFISEVKRRAGLDPEGIGAGDSLPKDHLEMPGFTVENVSSVSVSGLCPQAAFLVTTSSASGMDGYTVLGGFSISGLDPKKTYKIHFAKKEAPEEGSVPKVHPHPKKKAEMDHYTGPEWADPYPPQGSEYREFHDTMPATHPDSMEQIMREVHFDSADEMGNIHRLFYHRDTVWRRRHTL